MASRTEIISRFYDQADEDGRLQRSRHGQLEYAVTMNYIHRYASEGSSILETGAGTGRYSAALAEEGFHVTAVELTENNFLILQKKSRDIKNLKAVQGDATDLSSFADQSFDMTLVLGPLYHLYEKEDINKAIDEAIRVTKKDGIIFFAFLSVFGIMYANYFQGNWAFGQTENFTDDLNIRHFKEQLFTGYDVTEFEQLFAGKPVQWITTAGTDGILEPIEERSDFTITDEDFRQFTDWYLAFAEKRELLGSTNHLLYICRRL
ncbi:MAG: class I SAM-dependent methyltransferase [Solobacterium sp.]|nr:class I SAM-dependent methyltransferase [Solobacterium sp.]